MAAPAAPAAPAGAPELSPLAQWQLMQSRKAQGRAESARGISGTGGSAQREMEAEAGIAGQDYINQYSRILDALKIGTGASGAAGNAASQYSSQVGAAGANQGNILMDQGQSNANFWQGLGTVPMDAYNLYQKSQVPPVSQGQFLANGGSMGAYNANQLLGSSSGLLI
jgi:hypothetical protein